jgi:hypothetical protein
MSPMTDPEQPVAPQQTIVDMAGEPLAEIISEDPVGFWPVWLRRLLYVFGVMWAAVAGTIFAWYVARDAEPHIAFVAVNAGIGALIPLIANSNVRRS